MLQAVLVAGGLGCPWSVDGQEVEDAAENHPSGEDRPVVPSHNPWAENGGPQQSPWGCLLKCRFLGPAFEIFFLIN